VTTDVTWWRLTELPTGFPVAVRVRQLTEHVQGDSDLIYRLKDAGVGANARVTVQVSDSGSVMIVIPATNRSNSRTTWRTPSRWRRSTGRRPIGRGGRQSNADALRQA